MSEDKVRRENEEKYFLRKETELREKLKQRLQEEAHVARLKGEFGEADERVLKAFEEAGFSRETVVLLHLVPLVEVAWADGSVTGAERLQIHEVAKHRDIKPGTAAFDLLEKWLTERPKQEAFDACRRAIRVIFESLPPEKQTSLENELLTAVQHVAKASGGFLGMGHRINDAEHVAIEKLVKAFEEGHAAAARKVASQL
jgi:hypothetical protein